MNEQLILNSIAHLLNAGSSAKFDDGQLRVYGDKNVANNIYIILCNMHRKRKIRYEVINDSEFVFKFLP
jgi:hypothetical protein